MDRQASKILLCSIVELQECLQEQFERGELDLVGVLWQTQRERARRLRDGNNYTGPHSPGTPKTDLGDGQGS
jgi:hypothetical protein